MFNPADMARLAAKKKHQKQEQEAVEISINRHFAFEPECEHHCSDCCPALYLKETS